jgi:hypothetical protein
MPPGAAGGILAGSGRSQATVSFAITSASDPASCRVASAPGAAETMPKKVVTEFEP